MHYHTPVLKNAIQTEMLSENELVGMAAASEIALASDFPSTYCLNEEDFVVSLLSGDKTGVASSAGSLDEDTPPDALAEQDMELSS